jgi:threonine dehydratase
MSSPDAVKVTEVIPTAREVDEAREVLRKYLQPTRLVRAESLKACTDGQVYLKVETDLPTGSFKPRGALNALLTNAEQRTLAGVVAASTGNHGAAVAFAARIANLVATIFLPENPNPVKRARILGLGAKVVEHGAADQLAAIEAAAVFAREHGHYFLDDASDSLVPAGAATIASEILDDVPRTDAIFVPIGDTALIRGVAAEAKRRHPKIRIVGVQAEQAPAYTRSSPIHATRLQMGWQHGIHVKRMYMRSVSWWTKCVWYRSGNCLMPSASFCSMSISWPKLPAQRRRQHFFRTQLPTLVATSCYSSPAPIFRQRFFAVR